MVPAGTLDLGFRVFVRRTASISRPEGYVTLGVVRTYTNPDSEGIFHMETSPNTDERLQSKT